jgi:lysophospholipase
MTELKFDRRMIPADAVVQDQPMRDGWPIRTFEWPVAGAVRGNILFLGGRGDFFEKYLESLADWHRDGWSIASFDWRGQGGSGRLGSDPNVGHIEHFSDWIDDLAEVYGAWKARTAGPHVVIAHSMGSHLALRAVIERRIDPAALVLMSPMLGFNTGALPASWAAWIAQRLAARGAMDRQAWKDNEKATAAWNERHTYLTHDPARYADEVWWKHQHPELAVGPPSWQWLIEANSSMRAITAPRLLEAVNTPVLLIGTDEDKLVNAHAMRSVAARLPEAAIKMFDKDVAHEILRERDDVRGEAMALIGSFLDRAATEH